MPRNAEVIRQWTILREIERARGGGVTIDELAAICAVTTRTIRRDLQALEESGFPLFDDRTHDDGKTRWRVNGQAFKGLSAGLTVSELCALYFSRTLPSRYRAHRFVTASRAFEKLASVLTPHAGFSIGCRASSPPRRIRCAAATTRTAALHRPRARGDVACARPT